MEPSIDDMANDAYAAAPSAWRGLLLRYLSAYGWRVVREGGAIVSRGRVQLQNWEVRK